MFPFDTCEQTYPLSILVHEGVKQSRNLVVTARTCDYRHRAADNSANTHKQIGQRLSLFSNHVLERRDLVLEENARLVVSHRIESNGHLVVRLINGILRVTERTHRNLV